VRVAIVDYGSGNLRSAAKAFERSAREAEVGAEIEVTDEPKRVAEADRVVLPGVGAFRDCWEGLDRTAGMRAAVIRAGVERAVPFLGICVGMQLMADVGREFGDCEGFGWIPGAVEAIRPSDPALKIPHMGWNAFTAPLKPHALLAGVAPGDYAYFVHSFAMRPANAGHVLAEVDYGGPVTAMIGRDNIAGVQFHPEKSQRTGLRLIANFLKWDP